MVTITNQLCCPRLKDLAYARQKKAPLILSAHIYVQVSCKYAPVCLYVSDTHEYTQCMGPGLPVMVSPPLLVSLCVHTGCISLLFRREHQLSWEGGRKTPVRDCVGRED